MTNIKLECVVKLIRECKTFGELTFVEDVHIKGKFGGMDKVDLEIECLKKFQELREKK